VLDEPKNLKDIFLTFARESSDLKKIKLKNNNAS
jgi:hypothetical protein